MSCIIELGMRICLCIGHKSQFPSIEICPRHFYRVFFLHLANGHRTMHLRILARQGRIDLPYPRLADAQRLSLLRRFLRKRASVICCLSEWLMPFASYPAFSQPSPYNASVHSGPARSYRLPCSGPVCQLHKLYSSSHCRSASQTVSSERFRCPL